MDFGETFCCVHKPTCCELKITDTFADKFDQLYNSVPAASGTMEQNSDFIQTNCQHCEDKVCIETKEDISEAIKYLKSGKSDCDKDLYPTIS